MYQFIIIVDSVREVRYQLSAREEEVKRNLRNHTLRVPRNSPERQASQLEPSR